MVRGRVGRCSVSSCFAVLAVALVACSSTPPPTSERAATSRVQVTAEQPSARPSPPAVVESPEPSSESSSEPSPEAPPQKSPLSVVAKMPGWGDVFRLGDTTIVESRGLIAVVEGTRIVARGTDQAGLNVIDSDIGVLALLGGRWPRPAWALIAMPGGSTDPWTELYRRTVGSWRKVRRLGFTETFLSIEPWAGGAFLALRKGVGPRMQFEVLGGGTAFPLPRPTPCPQQANTPAADPWVEAMAFRALPSGHVFVAGTSCDDRAFVVERWAPGQRDGIVERLPSWKPEEAKLNWSEPKLALASEKEAYVIVEPSRFAAKRIPYLAAFDGAKWTRLDVPGAKGLDSVSVAPGAGLWVTDTAGSLFRRDPAGTWSRVPLPPGFAYAAEVVVVDEGDVWVWSKYAKKEEGAPSRWRLLRTIAHPEVYEPDPWAVQAELPPREPDRYCSSVFVHIASLDGKTTAEDWLRWLEPAFRGEEFLVNRFVLAEVDDNGRRSLGAIILPDPGKDSVGRKVAKAVRAKLPTVRPQVWCRRPGLLRAWKVHHETGTSKPYPAEKVHR